MNNPLNENSSGGNVYECTDCLEHHTSVTSLAACPTCGGNVENLTKDSAE